MKLTKIFAVALTALLATACSDDDEMTYNTQAGVVVEMESNQVTVMENQGVFSVPMKIQGERNGYITVTVECTETGANPAMANRHYYLTTDRINIADDAKTADIELRAQDFRGLDPDRTFNVTIVSVQGGEVGANKTATVTILDKGSSPVYNDLPGAYLMAYNSQNEETGVLDVENVTDVTVSRGTPDDNGGGTIVVSGILGMFQMELTYDYDTEEKYGELVFNYGIPAMVNPAPYDKIIWVTQQNGSDGVVRGKWNSTYTAVTFGDESSFFGIAVYDPTYRGMFDAIGRFTLIKPQTAE